jgi:single-stranded-DNA-specific exonuclease
MSESGVGVPWVILECDEALAQSLAREAGVPKAIGRLLVNRGVITSEDAKRFLSPSLDHLHDPELLPDLEEGVARVAQAVKDREPVFVYGDYDVDGITSAALLVRTLRALDAPVHYRLPRRFEGYDIKPAHVHEAAKLGAGVVVTCDCGVSAIAAGEAAGECGVDLVITDHHEPGDDLPSALAVINPKRGDCGYPFPELAGVGVAAKFAQALVRKLGHDDQAYLGRFLDLVALGTVGDVVPLLDENRALVSFGLDAVPASKKLGLQMLLERSGLVGKRLTAYTLGYVLGPRINAVGRMDDASLALKLLLTKDRDEAGTLAGKMEQCNTERRAEQGRILQEATKLVEAKDLDKVRALVLVGDGWNPGVIGIVAGKIREAFFRPAILLNRDPKSGMCSGSGRSIPTFNLYEALCECSEVLERFGGHAQAAGLTIKDENVERFEEMLNAVAEEAIPEEELVPRVEVEAELAPEELTVDLARLLAGMEPFGVGNPEPLFMTRGLVVKQRQRVGDGSHLKLEVASDGKPPISCIAFRMGDMCDALQLGCKVDLCYNLRLNEFNGVTTAQLVVSGINPQ